MNIYRRYISLLLSLMLLLPATSCARTPTSDIVVNKSDESFYNTAPADDNESQSDFQIFPPSDIEAVFTSDNNDVTFNVDAHIYLPDNESFSVFKTTALFFTPDDLKLIATTIFDENPVYEYSEVLSKPEIEQEILEIKKFIGDRDYLMDYYNGDEAIIDSVVSEFENRLFALEAAYHTAPNTPTYIPSDFEYHEDSYYYPDTSVMEGIEGIYTVKATSIVDGVPMYMNAAKRNDSKYILSNVKIYPYDFRKPQLVAADFFQTRKFSNNDYTEAVELVERTLHDVGLTDWSIQSYTLSDNSVTFMCIPTFGGIPLSSNQYWGSLSSSFLYNPLYKYPKLEITVSDGKILRFWLENPLSVTEIINENVSILAFSDVIERIYDQLELSWTPKRIGEYILPDVGIEVLSASIDVTNIELTLVRVSAQDDPCSFYIIPAWMVYGTPSIDQYVIDGEKVSDSTSGGYSNIPLLVINAIDGSVIDMSQGY